MFLFQPIKTLLIFSLLLYMQEGYAQKAGKEELVYHTKQVKKLKQRFDWEALQSKENSVNIDTLHLSGLWKAYNGLFLFNGMVNSMDLFKPFVIEIKGSEIRRSENSGFTSFALKGNSLLIESGEAEEGFINLITDKLLVISWKSGSNYTRYYYERSE